MAAGWGAGGGTCRETEEGRTLRATVRSDGSERGSERGSTVAERLCRVRQPYPPAVGAKYGVRRNACQPEAQHARLAGLSPVSCESRASSATAGAAAAQVVRTHRLPPPVGASRRRPLPAPTPVHQMTVRDRRRSRALGQAARDPSARGPSRPAKARRDVGRPTPWAAGRPRAATEARSGAGGVRQPGPERGRAVWRRARTLAGRIRSRMHI